MNANTSFSEWEHNLPNVSHHMTTPERTAVVVEWLVAVCGWDGVASAMDAHAAKLRNDCPELLSQWGGREALPSLLRVAQHLLEADA